MRSEENLYGAPTDFIPVSHYSEPSHKKWLAKALGIPYLPRPHGIDLLGTAIGIELKCKRKFSKDPSKKRRSSGYKVAWYQFENYPQMYSQDLFWAFLEYQLKYDNGHIRNKRIASDIISREAWLFPWHWVKDNVQPKETDAGLYANIRETLIKSAMTLTTFVDEGLIHLHPTIIHLVNVS